MIFRCREIPEVTFFFYFYSRIAEEQTDTSPPDENDDGACEDDLDFHIDLESDEDNGELTKDVNSRKCKNTEVIGQH